MLHSTLDCHCLKAWKMLRSGLRHSLSGEVDMHETTETYIQLLCLL